MTRSVLRRREAVNAARELPRDTNRILRDEPVGAEDHEPVHDGLAHEHAIEGIAMECRQPVEMQMTTVSPAATRARYRERCQFHRSQGAR
jgi:hypothetical protein